MNDTTGNREVGMVAVLRRLLIGIILLQGATAWGQQPNNAPCNGNGNGHPEHSYYQTVWDDILPSGKPNPVIVITMSNYFHSKLVMRAQDSKRFELFRLARPESLFKSLDDLGATCRLPLNPLEAVKLLDVHWETVEISSSQFDRLHRDFTAALTAYVADSQRRYGTVLVEGGIMILHGTEYDISYDNDGYEHIAVEVNDGTDLSGRAFPLSNWAHEFMAFSEESFQKGR